MNRIIGNGKNNKTTAALFLVLPLLALLPPVHATTPSAASGTINVLSAAFTLVRTADGNTIYNVSERDLYSGTLAGTTVGTSIAVVDSTGYFTLHGRDVFTGTVNGASGTLVLLLTATGTIPASFQGHLVILSGTDGLSNLRGQWIALGPVGGSGPYSGQIHFDPS